MKTRWMAVALVGALLAPAAAFAAAPVMEIASTNHDFGEVFKNEKFAHTFVVKNVGDADLVIDDVKPGCGCTVAKFDRLIPPGQTGNVELELDGSKVQGKFTKSAMVASNDPTHPNIQLTISGHSIAYVNVEPEGTVYMHGRYGESVEHDLAITSNEKGLDFKVLGVRSNIDDKITYSLENGVAPGEYNLKVFKNPKLPTLSTYGTITLTTNSPKWPETTVQVHVMTKGSITISPSILNFGPVKFPEGNGAGAPATKSLVVSKTGAPFKIKDVTVTNPNYKAVVNTVTDGQQYRIEVAFTPPVRRQSKHTEAGEMMIHTDDPKEPAIRVQLVARAQ